MKLGKNYKRKDKNQKSKTLQTRFVVEGEGVVSDYLSLNPSMVEVIVGEETHHSCLKTDSYSHIRKVELAKGERYEIDSHRSSSSCWAIAHIQTIDERGLMNELENSQPPTLLICDHITDPRNLGAIVRSAAFFGLPYLIIAKNRQVSITPSAVSTAQAGFAFTKVVEVTNLSRTVEKIKGLSYWVSGADMEGEPVEQISGFYQKNAIILGSEDKGISHNLRKKCDRLVAIHSPGRTIDSLNVSVAAGILINYFQPCIKK